MLRKVKSYHENTKSEQKPLPKPPQPEPIREIFTFPDKSRDKNSDRSQK